MPEPADSAPGPWAEEHDHPWATHSHPGGTSPHAHPAAERPAPGNGVPVSPSLVRVEEALTAWLDDLTSGTATRDAYVQALGRLTRAEYEEARTSGLLCSYWEKPRAAPAGPVPEPVS
jgi:hypothetical protein